MGDKETMISFRAAIDKHKLNKEKKDLTIDLLVESIRDMIQARIPRRSRLTQMLERTVSVGKMGKKGYNLDTFTDELILEMGVCEWSTMTVAEATALFWLKDLDSSDKDQEELGKTVNKAWDLAEKNSEIFTVEDCRRIAKLHWEAVRSNEITLSRAQGQNGLVVTKDGKTTKRKRKKGKKAASDPKGKEETVAAATKEEKKDDKPQAEPDYCFRCGVEGHKVAGCAHKGHLKCENHPNHTSHMTEAYHLTRLKKGLPLHSFMQAKRTPSHGGNHLSLEANSSFEGALDDSLTIFSGGESPTEDLNGCSAVLESMGADFTDSDSSPEVSSGEESDTESLRQPNMRSYRHVLRTTKAGRRRLLKGGDVGRITGSIRLSEYVSCRASTIETPSYSLLITS